MLELGQQWWWLQSLTLEEGDCAGPGAGLGAGPGGKILVWVVGVFQLKPAFR